MRKMQIENEKGSANTSIYTKQMGDFTTALRIGNTQEKGLVSELQKDAMNDGIIFITGTIEDWMSQTVIWPLHKLGMTQVQAETKTPIKIFINSPGGDYYTSLAIADEIIGLGIIGVPIHTHIMGMCASGAAFIAMAGHYRTCNPNTMIMLHSIQTILAGNLHDMKEEIANSLDPIEQQITKYLLSTTKLTKEKIKDIMKKDTYFNPSQAKRLGIVDDILYNPKTINLDKIRKDAK